MPSRLMRDIAQPILFESVGPLGRCYTQDMRNPLGDFMRIILSCPELARKTKRLYLEMSYGSIEMQDPSPKFLSALHRVHEAAGSTQMSNKVTIDEFTTVLISCYTHNLDTPAQISNALRAHQETIE